ncbi:A/G-specific adenine glycosylase [Terriglobus sp.]|uniref:A/G-specific adenine glycosylase n=1 Tax=Terriglobus sp. TaxID=1889013 RepID=UPI003B0024A0
MASQATSTTRSRIPRTPVELPLDAEAQAAFAAALLAWYRRHARDLPWRREPSPYRTWVSEIMLQQTRVNAVLEHFHAFTERFPTVVALALAPEEEVLSRWSGLGYYRRARMLHRAAKFLLQEHEGTLPRTAAELRTLPGIGSYTAAAIASIAFGERAAVVDGNVERVLLRIAGRPEQADRETVDFVQRFAQALIDAPACEAEQSGTPAPPPGDHNQAMMELGATVCLPRAPRCLECPVYDWCRTRGEHPTPERAAMKSERVAYALATRNTGARGGVEVLLHRRDADLSLMPGMLELPTLSTAPASEPMLRLRHAIVGTNYYAEVFGITNRQQVRRFALPGHQTAWFDAQLLDRLPLTGFARKVLQRTGLMAPAVAPSALSMESIPLASFPSQTRTVRSVRTPPAESGPGPLFMTARNGGKGTKQDI